MKCLYTCALLLILLQNAFPQDSAWIYVPAPNLDLAFKITSGNNNDLFVSSARGIFVTNDDCKTWKMLPHADSVAPWIRELIITKNNYLVGNTQNKTLYVTTNMGVNWQKISLPYSLIYMNCDSSGTLWAKSAEGFFKSKDLGFHWERINITETIYDQVCISRQNVIYLNARTSLYHSTDNGVTWIKNPSPGDLGTIAVNPQGVIFTSVGYKGFSSSTDKGKTWLLKSNNYITFTDITFDKQGNIFFCHAERGAYISMDTAQTWMYLGCKRYPLTIFMHNYNVYVAGYEMYKYNYNYTPLPPPKIKYPLNLRNAWQYSTYDLFHSSTGGETSNLGLYSVYVLADTIINNYTYYKLSDSPNDWIRYSEKDNKLYLFYNNQDTVYSEFSLMEGTLTFQFLPNEHTSWPASVTTGKDTVLGVASNFVSLLGGGSGTSSIQKKYNSGLGHTYYRYYSYHTGSGGLNYELFLISARIFENGKLIDYSLPYYPEIEITPPKVITDLSLQFSFKVKHKYNTLVSTGKSLIYIDSVYLTGFYKKNESVIGNIKIIPENLAQTYVYMVDTTLSLDLLKQGYSFYFKVFASDKALIPKTTTKPDTGYFCISYSDPNSVNSSDVNLYSFELKQNYPNPANPSSFISYSIPSATRVKITLYNSLGQIIRILEDSEKPAGNYKTIFNGSGLSSGIYFYRLTAGNYSATRKLILMK